MAEELNLHSLTPAQPRKDRKRVGRGLGSGKGRYSGRGIKGQKSRSGWAASAAAPSTRSLRRSPECSARSATSSRSKMPEKQLNLTNLAPAQPREDRKRVGRGMGSGKGRYSGRGIKGQKSRSGSHKMRAGFEGGQMPIYMRLGKLRGNTSKDAMPIGPFRTYTQPINLRALDRFEAGDEVTPETLVEKRLIKNTRTDVKLLGVGVVTKKLTVRVHAISASAREKIEGAGGTVELLREPKVKKVRHRKAKPTRDEEREAVAEENAETAEEPAVEEADESEGTEE